MPGSSLLCRIDIPLSWVSHLSCLTGPHLVREAAFMAAGVVVVERSDQVLAAWDGEPSRGLGGNSDVVRYAKREHKPVTNVWPRGLERE